MTKAICYFLGVVMFICGCKKPPVEHPTEHRSMTFTIWANHLEPGEKLYIYYANNNISFSDSTTSLRWVQSDTGTGVVAIRAMIRIPGTKNYISPTNDTIWCSMVQNNLNLETGYTTQSTYLDLSMSHVY